MMGRGRRQETNEKESFQNLKVRVLNRREMVK